MPIAPHLQDQLSKLTPEQLDSLKQEFLKNQGTDTGDSSKTLLQKGILNGISSFGQGAVLGLQNRPVSEIQLPKEKNADYKKLIAEENIKNSMDPSRKLQQKVIDNLDNPQAGDGTDSNVILDKYGNPDTQKSLTLKEHNDQFNQKEWDKIVKETDINSSTPRSAIGISVAGNLKADRALLRLQSPTITNQEGGNIMADIAGIYQNGSPTEYGMSEQAYNTLMAKIANTQQFFTGQPTDAITPEIKDRLKTVLNELKSVNNAKIQEKLDYIEKAKAKVIKNFPDEWQGMKDVILRGTQNPQPVQAKTENTHVIPSIGSTFNGEKVTGVRKISGR